jgi:hypothetical protein
MFIQDYHIVMFVLFKGSFSQLADFTTCHLNLYRNDINWKKHRLYFCIIIEKGKNITSNYSSHTLEIVVFRFRRIILVIRHRFSRIQIAFKSIFPQIYFSIPHGVMLNGNPSFSSV